MKTITFYSYKGGVGRSLALSNIAMRLSEFKKTVCVIDFDLEAPGLEYKFKSYNRFGNPDIGLIDYIHKFACEGVLPESLKPYITTLLRGNNIFTPISFIPAGAFTKPDYWKKLSSIHWNELFQPNGNGVKFFLDLKAKVEKEVNPDFLLIDSRTGITDISGITLRLLADDVVILAANNQENIVGSGMVINSITDAKNILFDKVPKIHFVLTRLPFTSKSEDRVKETGIIQRVIKGLNAKIQSPLGEIHIIHSDRRLEEEERPMIGYETDGETESISIAKDYLNLFNVLTKDILTPEEVDSFNNIKRAERLLQEVLEEPDNSRKMELLDKALKLCPNMFDLYLHKGGIAFEQGDFNAAIESYSRANELRPNLSEVIFNIGAAYHNLEEYDKALKYYDKACALDSQDADIYISKSSIFYLRNEVEKAIDILNDYLKINGENNAEVLNIRANYYRKQGKYTQAYHDIQKAISLNPKSGLYFGTLAEIYASDGKIEKFYFNLNIALSNELTIDNIKTSLDVYEKFKDDPAFIELLARYGMDVNDLFEKQ